MQGFVLLMFLTYFLIGGHINFECSNRAYFFLAKLSNTSYFHLSQTVEIEKEKANLGVQIFPVSRMSPAAASRDKFTRNSVVNNIKEGSYSFYL